MTVKAVLGYRFQPGMIRRSISNVCVNSFAIAVTDGTVIFDQSSTATRGTTKAELPQEGILLCTQFLSLVIFINKKVGFLKN